MESPGTSIVVHNQSNKRKLDEEFNSDGRFANQHEKRARFEAWRDDNNPVQGTSATYPSRRGSTYGMYSVVMSNPCSVQAIGVHLSTSKINGACSPSTSRVYEDPYLLSELQGQEHREIQFDKFLRAVFKETYMDLEHRCSQISTSAEIRGNLRAYLEVAHRSEALEKELYDPFATLVSSIITAAGVSDFGYIQTHELPLHDAVGNAQRK